MSSVHSGPKNPVFTAELSAQDIADGYVEHKCSLFSGLRYFKIEASQNANPGEAHKIQFNENTGDYPATIVHGTPLVIQLTDGCPEQCTIKRFYLRAGKDGTSFTVIGWV